MTNELETSDCVMCPQTDPPNGEQAPVVETKPKRSHHKQRPVKANLHLKTVEEERIELLVEARAAVVRAEEFLYAAVAEGLDDGELDAIRTEMWDARMAVWGLEKGAAS